jgi:hypothetical protein
MPVDISVHGPKIDHQIEETVLVAGLLFIAGQVVLAVFAFLYGGAGRKTRQIPGGAKPLVIFAFLLVGTEVLALSFIGSKAWGAVYPCASMFRLDSSPIISAIPVRTANSAPSIPTLLTKVRKTTSGSTLTMIPMPKTTL